MNSMMRPCAILIAAIACLPAAGEPIVLRWDPGVRSVSLSDLSSEVPQVRLSRTEIVGGGSTIVAPNIRPEGWNAQGLCEPPPFAGELAQSGFGSNYGVPIDPLQASWEDAYACFEFDSNWPMILSRTNDFMCSVQGCPVDFALFGIAPGVYSVPLRFEDDQGAWHAAWIAISVQETVYPDCDLCTDNPPGDLVVGDFEYIGFGYESEPNTIIFNGGGLCEADLTFDTVLDLADLAAFVESFLAGDSPADITGDGIYDLADVQRFIGSFNTGCGL